MIALPLLTIFGLVISTFSKKYSVGLVAKYKSGTALTNEGESTDTISFKDFASEAVKAYTDAHPTGEEATSYPVLYMIEPFLYANYFANAEEDLKKITDGAETVKVHSQIETTGSYALFNEFSAAFANETIKPANVQLYCQNSNDASCKKLQDVKGVTFVEGTEVNPAIVTPDTAIIYLFKSPAAGESFVPHIDDAKKILDALKAAKGEGESVLIPTLGYVYSGEDFIYTISNPLWMSPGVLQGLIVLFAVGAAVVFSIWLSLCVQSPGDMDTQDNIAQAVQASKHHKEN